MSTQPHCDVNRRHDFIILFDVQDGNPNGDPDAGNQPRMDPETMQGIVTDVSLKRKVRDYVDVAHGDESRYKIYVQRETYLTETRGRVFDEKRGDNDAPTPRQAQTWLCEQFYDIRMFGAVMSMRERNAGQVRGPVQLTFSRSIDPILAMDSTIARVALENRGERGTESDDKRTRSTHSRHAGPQVHRALRPLPRLRIFQPPLRQEHRRRLGRSGNFLESLGQYVGP